MAPARGGERGPGDLKPDFEVRRLEGLVGLMDRAGP
jgi:hypothetical protein